MAAPVPDHHQQALNRAMLEAVDFIHAEGWEAPPTLFGLVPTALIDAAFIPADAADEPLTLVVQDALPATVTPGSPALADYLSRITWPHEVVGVILAQEIQFRDTTATTDSPRPARLFSGVLRGEAELTLIQVRPTAEELAELGPFGEDQVQLRGGPGVAPEVLAALRYGLEANPFADDAEPSDYS